MYCDNCDNMIIKIEFDICNQPMGIPYNIIYDDGQTTGMPIYNKTYTTGMPIYSEYTKTYIIC